MIVIRDVRDGNSLRLPDFYREHAIISTIDVIISASDGTPYGILEVDSPVMHQYDEHDVIFLTGFANVLAEAVARTEKNEATRQSQKMETIGRLTGGVAHDFNKLLAILISYLDLLQAMPSGGEAAELVTGALAAALRGVALTEQLLAFARLQPLHPTRLALNNEVADLFRLLARTLGQRVTIVLDLEPNLRPVLADSTQLQASLINLASNARDAMPNGGTLKITTSNVHFDATYVVSHAEVLAGDYAMIEVSDTGVGIPPGVLGQVFDPFFTTKTQQHGTGLGLSMVFGFIKQSNGHITVSSEPGIGTTFRIYLPDVVEEAKPAAPAAAAAGAQHGNGERVLVVEDEARLRDVAVRILRSLDYQVIEADSAAAALEMLTERPIDVVFSDITMPGELDGVGLASHILRHWPTTKVILTSGFPEAQIMGTLSEEVRDHVFMLKKPYRRTELAHAAWAVLRR